MAQTQVRRIGVAGRGCGASWRLGMGASNRDEKVAPCIRFGEVMQCFFFFQAEDGIRDLTVTGFRRVLFRSVDAGCCGMAGSFGFEKEHYDLSMAIGERRLLPALRALPADAPVVAMGVSCRQQILHGTGRRALHLVELLAQTLTDGNAATRDRGNAD